MNKLKIYSIFHKLTYKFDAWVRRRNPADRTHNNIPTKFFLDRRFTRHEHIDQLALINMNGRVYDPILAMFLSPDNFVQARDLMQAFNWYSYCLNNLLKFTDPGVEWFITTLFTLVRIWLSGAMGSNWQSNPEK
jgi:RHS repeat-associated protein